ncbi:MAG TPA: cell wall hydrolase [Rhizomicrobium sp.]|jgi:spore germination cell wall hydrolase CwlJ-like protein|nr:cell wall hydrolase [Rhizomicrobium sp.]
MSRHNAISRSDRVLFAVLAILLATASAAIGAAMTWRPITPSTDHVAVRPVAPDMVLTQLVAEHRCLSEALYYEARGEGRTGQQAVAEVVFHRMNAGNYGHSICAVVYEGASRPGCQFSFTCNGALHRPREAPAWKQSEQLAAQILTHEMPLRDATGGATNYHAISVSPFWAPTLKRTTQIGNHIFYRGRIGHTHAS